MHGRTGKEICIRVNHTSIDSLSDAFRLQLKNSGSRQHTQAVESFLTAENVAVVIPVFNEERFVARVLAEIPDWVGNIIVVDDGSTDRSRERAGQISDPRIRILTHPVNRGVGAAIVTGYKAALNAGAQIVAVMGGDGQMDAADLYRVVEPVAKGWADYVKGNRFLYRQAQSQETDQPVPLKDLDTGSSRVMPSGGKQNAGRKRMPISRKLGIGVFSALTRWVSGFREIGDAQCGYTAASRKLLEHLDLDGLTEGYGYPNDMLIRVLAGGFRMREVPVRPIYGDEQSGIRPWIDLPRMALRILRMKSFVTRMGIKEHQQAAETGHRIILTTSFPRFMGDHAGSFIAAMAETMAGQGSVTVIAPDFPGAAWEPPGIRVRRFRWIGWNSRYSLPYGNGIMENLAAHPSVIIQVPSFLRAMRRALLDECSAGDQVISNWLVPCAWMASGCRNHVAVAHGSDVGLLERMPAPVRRMICNRIAGSAQRIVVVSNNLRERISTMIPVENQPEIVVHPMGIPFEQGFVVRKTRTLHRGLAAVPLSGRSVKCILFMGRLIPIKGVDVLLRAVAGDEPIRRNCMVCIAGDGPERKRLQKLADDLNVRAVFTGYAGGSQKDSILERADLAVIPSIRATKGREDGTPMVALEFMACGIPVIASRSGGLSDLITDGMNGLLFEPGDSSKLGVKIQFLLNNPVLVEKIVTEGFRSALKHDVRRMVQVIMGMENPHPASIGVMCTPYESSTKPDSL